MNNEITALIADDEAHIRTFLKFMLLELGIKKTNFVDNGRDAVEAYKEYSPDLVLMDINMDKMNGLKALESIMSINPDAVVVMLTAVSTRDTIERCHEYGAVYYIIKTQAPDVLKEELRQVVEGITA